MKTSLTLKFWFLSQNRRVVFLLDSFQKDAELWKGPRELCKRFSRDRTPRRAKAETCLPTASHGTGIKFPATPEILAFQPRTLLIAHQES